LLEFPKGRFSLPLKEAAHRLSGASLDLVVAVGEAQLQMAGQMPAHRGLAAARHAHQGYQAWELQFGTRHTAAKGPPEGGR
jgi:hypothetical protein